MNTWGSVFPIFNSSSNRWFVVHVSILQKHLSVDSSLKRAQLFLFLHFTSCLRLKIWVKKNQALKLLRVLDSFLMVAANAPEHEPFVTSPGRNKQKIYNNTLSEVILTSQGAVRQNALYDISSSDGYNNQQKIGDMTIHRVFSIWTTHKSKSSRRQANWDGIFLGVFFFFLQRFESIGRPAPFPLSHKKKKDKSLLADTSLVVKDAHKEAEAKISWSGDNHPVVEVPCKALWRCWHKNLHCILLQHN